MIISQYKKKKIHTFKFEWGCSYFTKGTYIHTSCLLSTTDEASRENIYKELLNSYTFD